MSKIKEIKKMLNDESGELAVEVLNKVKAIVDRDDGPKPKVAIKAIFTDVIGPLRQCELLVHEDVTELEIEVAIKGLTQISNHRFGEKNGN